MATSGSLTTTNSGGYRNVTFSWTLDSQSVSNNTSTISWSLTGASDGTDGWYYAGPFTVTLAPASGSTKTLVNNKYPAGSRIQLRDGTVVASGTTTISHNSSGVGTFDVSITASVYEASNNCTATGSFTPTAIPRASVFSNLASSYTVGTSSTINITRYLSGAYYAFSYKIGSGSRVNNYKTGSGTSFTWNFSEVGTAIPSAWSTTVTFYLKTYSDSSLSTQVGSEQTAAVTVNIPSAYSLSAPTVSVTEGNTANTSGAYIQSVSKPKWTITASGRYGSTITQYKVTFGGKTYTNTSSTVSATTAVGVSGTVRATITVVDSRGRTATLASSATDITVLAYTAPKITATAVRSASTNTTIVVTVTCSVKSITVSGAEKNTMAVKAEYGTTTSYGTTVTIQSAASSPLSLTNNTTNITGRSASSAYYFRMTVTDKWSSVPVTVKVPANSSFIDIQVGKIGIGKYAGSYSLNVLGNTYLEGTLTTTDNVGVGSSTGASDTYLTVRSNSGNIALETIGNANGDGSRGLWLGSTSALSARWLIREDGEGNAYVNGGTTPIGKMLQASNTVTSIANNTTIDICSITLTKGVWVVTGQFSCPGSGDFRLLVDISTASATYQTSSGGYINVPVTTAVTTMSVTPCRIINVTGSSQTVYLTANQNSGAAKTLTAGRCLLQAVCIA